MTTPRRLWLRSTWTLRALPIARKLQLVVVIFVCIIFAMLVLVNRASSFSAAARAYVQGEGSWSKAQKEATIHLQGYAASHNEDDYEDFLASLAVPIGERVAREELEKQSPNYPALYAGFRQGKVEESDIPGMVTLFRSFRNFKEIDTAVKI